MTEHVPDTLEKLYDLSTELSKSGVDFSKHTEDYLKIIEIVKSNNEKESVLATQLIARFMANFPEQAELAFNSITHLCKSSNVDARKHAMIAIMQCCNKHQQFVEQATSALLQIYKSEESSELNMLNTSLGKLISRDASKFLKGYVEGISMIEDCKAKEKAIEYLATKLQAQVESEKNNDARGQQQDLSKKSYDNNSFQNRQRQGYKQRYNNVQPNKRRRY